MINQVTMVLHITLIVVTLAYLAKLLLKSKTLEEHTDSLYDLGVSYFSPLCLQVKKQSLLNQTVARR